MRNIIVEPGALWRRFFPMLRTIRRWCWKVQDRIGIRFVVSGGDIPFLDATLQFPPGVALGYSTPLFWNGPGAYEGPTSRTLAALIKNSRLFLDVGSNVGIYAVYAGAKYPDLVTFAFEPVPSIWQKNRAFHQANELDDRHVLNLAVGDRVDTQTLILPLYDPRTSVEEVQTATLQIDSWQANEARVERIEVHCITLDHFAATHPLPEGFCCLKIDVENHEAAVLRGGRHFIQTRRPWIVCEILPGQKTDPATGAPVNDNTDVISLVQEFGYAAFALTNDGAFRMHPRDFIQVRPMKDFLFIPSEAVSDDASYLGQTSLEDLFTASKTYRSS